MNIEYIVVQAGGKGTRLGSLTRNRPKAIVPVNNLPLIFHLFQKYPDKKFLIIGDYKYDVLRRYLMNFAQEKYMLFRGEGEGNACGINQALQYIPDKTPFMIIWSDLLLSEEYEAAELADGCYVGVTGDFACSWSFRDGKLEKTASEGNGVAGCFLFDDKQRLAGLPDTGSFTRWLAASGLKLNSMDMKHSRETGTTSALKAVDSGENRCRPYNHMEFKNEMVIKTGLTPEGRKLIDREVKWYEAVTEYGFDAIPAIQSLSPLTMERIHGDNIFKAGLSPARKGQTLQKLMDAVRRLHACEVRDADCYDLQEEYYTKTIKRIRTIREVIPMTEQERIRINGKSCRNIFFHEEALLKAVRENLFDTRFGPIHGDCTLTNTMVDHEGNIFFIDARGYFGSKEVIGDICYDWAKLYYSIVGNFDNFNIKKFTLFIGENEVEYHIESEGWEEVKDFFLDGTGGCSEKKIKLIHAIIWLSLASHCWEDFDSMCTAFYNGIWLWNEWMEEYRFLDGVEEKGCRQE